VIPVGHYGTEHQCISCTCRWLVVSKVNHLSADSTTVYTKGIEARMQHRQVTWKDWYSYKLSNPEKWDHKHFRKEPGLPPTIKLELNKYLSDLGRLIDWIAGQRWSRVSISGTHCLTTTPQS
jgi:hypothetical protein